MVIQGKPTTVTIDRLKPAFILTNIAVQRPKKKYCYLKRKMLSENHDLEERCGAQITIALDGLWRGVVWRVRHAAMAT